MIKSFKLKIYPNRDKLSKIQDLFEFWKVSMQYKIDLFWEFESLAGSFPPSLHRSTGNRQLNDINLKAWQIVKIARKLKQEKPIYQGNEIDYNQMTFKYIDPETKEFDFWIKSSCLEKYKRISIPAKKHRAFNLALSKGKLKQSCKLWKSDKDVIYLVVYVEFPEVSKQNSKAVGIDTGLTMPVATSDGCFYGQDLKPLRIRTKHRTYKELSASKQALNKLAKQLTKEYPQTDFVFEDLKFKGKKGRSKEFRRRNNNFAYKHLGKKLDERGKLEGFSVYFVNPAYTSQTCPKCLLVNKGSRNGNSFNCVGCGYAAHADTVGATNILARLPRVYSEPLIQTNVLTI